MKGIFKSRKFYAAIVGLAVSIFGTRAGLDEATITSAVYTIIAYILGVALDDGLRARA